MVSMNHRFSMRMSWHTPCPLSSWLPGGFGEQDHEGVVFDGLDEVMVEAGGLGAARIELLSVTRTRDHDRVLEFHFLPESARDVVAVHPGKADVEQDDIGPAGPG